MFVKGEHEQQFACEAHTACDKKELVLGVEITAGKCYDSVARDIRTDYSKISANKIYGDGHRTKNLLDCKKNP